MVVGVPQGDAAEWLYFDTQSGLLLRKQTVLPTPVGNSPFQMDFEDYRDTGSGVKFPFVIHMNPANPRTELAPNATLRVTKVEDNRPSRTPSSSSRLPGWRLPNSPVGIDASFLKCEFFSFVFSWRRSHGNGQTAGSEGPGGRQ